VFSSLGGREIVSHLESATNGSETIELENSLVGLSAVEELGFVDLLVSLYLRGRETAYETKLISSHDALDLTNLLETVLRTSVLCPKTRCVN
jgi:hypothetical protein